MSNSEPSTPDNQKNENILSLLDPSKDDDQRTHSCIQWLLSLRGIYFALLSALMLSFSKTIIKKSPDLAGSDHSLIRYIIQLTALSFLIKHNKQDFLGPNNPKIRTLLTVRGLAGCIGMLFLHFAITFIAPSDTVAIAHSSVIITSILARIFLNEKFSIAHITALILTVLGILLISQPSFIFGAKYNHLNTTITNGSFIYNQEMHEINNYSNSIVILGISLALCAALTTGIVHTTIKKLCMEKVHFAVTIIYASYFGIPMSLIVSLVLYFNGVSYQRVNFEAGLNSILLQIAFSVVSGCFGLLGQISLNKALNYEDVSKIAIVKTVDLLFTYFFQLVLLDIRKDFLSTLGAYSILLGTFSILIFKLFEKNLLKPKSQNELNEVHKDFNFLNKLKFCLFFRF